VPLVNAKQRNQLATKSVRRRDIREGLALKRAPPALSFRTRASAYRIVQTLPGITLPELARRLALPPNTLRHHIRVLQEEGLIRSRRLGRSLSLFTTQTLVIHDLEAQAILRDPTARRIVAAILDTHVQSVVHLVELTGLSQRVVYHHAKKLLEAGLITTRDDRGYHRLRPTVKLYETLAAAHPHEDP
jgi:predicted transcriptional regulator